MRVSVRFRVQDEVQVKVKVKIRGERMTHRWGGRVVSMSQQAEGEEGGSSFRFKDERKVRGLL